MKTIVLNENDRNVSCIVGENAKDNWAMLDNVSNKEYYFLHLTSFPSCFVILQSETPTCLELKEAGLLCKKNTKYKNLRNTKVDYCKCSNVVNGSVCGEVEFKSMRKVCKITI